MNMMVIAIIKWDTLLMYLVCFVPASDDDCDAGDAEG